MTDDAIANPSPTPHSHPQPLAVLSLSAPTNAQPEFDEHAALINAASAEDGSVEEVILLRLLVFRRAHPDAIVATRLERFDDGEVVVRAKITLGSGAGASAHAVTEGGVAGIERAEHRALGRALEFLGEAVLVNVTTQDDASDGETDAPPAVSPVSAEAPIGVGLDLDIWDDEFQSDEGVPSLEPESEPESFEDGEEAEAEPEPQPLREIPPPRFSSSPPRERPNSRYREPQQHHEPQEPQVEDGQDVAPPPAVVDAVRRANLRRQGVSQGEREPSASTHDFSESATSESTSTSTSTGQDGGQEDAPLENYSWTAFWRVARPQGLDKIKVEQIIGEPITPLTPLQVREKLKAAGYDL